MFHRGHDKVETARKWIAEPSGSLADLTSDQQVRPGGTWKALIVHSDAGSGSHIDDLHFIIADK